MLLLNAFKQQHLISSASNKKQQDVLTAALLDANNNRITSVNNNATSSALSLNSISQSVKNSNLSNSNATSNKCTSPSTTDLNTLASVVNNLFALNSLQAESDSNNNSISCKNQNELLSAAAAGEYLDGNNNSSSSTNRNPLTSAGLLATAANLGELNSVLQDCNNNTNHANHNKLLSNSTAANQSGNSLGTITKAFDIMAKMASGSGGSSASSLDNACKNLLVQVDADGTGSNMDSEDQQTQSDIDLNTQILEDEQFQFRLTPPTNNNGGSAFPNLQYICQYSSKLLFLSVQWAQSIAIFKKFIEQNQIQLLKSCWCDLFILGEPFD